MEMTVKDKPRDRVFTAPMTLGGLCDSDLMKRCNTLERANVALLGEVESLRKELDKLKRANDMKLEIIRMICMDDSEER